MKYKVTLNNRVYEVEVEMGHPQEYCRIARIFDEVQQENLPKRRVLNR